MFKEFEKIIIWYGVVMIDNFSVFCMDVDVFLVVFEVNVVDVKDCLCGVIVNLNCIIIQMVVVLKVIEEFFYIKIVYVFIYQVVSGVGVVVMDEFYEQYCQVLVNEFVIVEKFVYQLVFNLIF